MTQSLASTLETSFLNAEMTPSPAPLRAVAAVSEKPVAPAFLPAWELAAAAKKAKLAQVVPPHDKQPMWRGIAAINDGISPSPIALRPVVEVVQEPVVPHELPVWTISSQAAKAKRAEKAAEPVPRWPGVAFLSSFESDVRFDEEERSAVLVGVPLSAPAPAPAQAPTKVPAEGAPRVRHPTKALAEGVQPLGWSGLSMAMSATTLNCTPSPPPRRRKPLVATPQEEVDKENDVDEATAWHGSEGFSAFSPLSLILS